MEEASSPCTIVAIGMVEVEDCQQKQQQCNVVHGPRRGRLQERHTEGGLVRTVHAPHVIKSAEVEELSRAEARNFDPSPT